jgi:sugar phosphate isomerase/epimerase
MFSTGLVSVTLRSLAARDVADMAARAGLDGVEWSATAHAPAGDLDAARHVRAITRDAGLRMLCYGSYFRCREGEDFLPVLRSAEVLGVPLIRIWAGDMGSADADEMHCAMVAANAQRACDLAYQQGIRVAFEFHDKSLTDTSESALRLLDDVPGAMSLWQPPHATSEHDQLLGLARLLQHIENVHVFHWQPRDTRHPLRAGAGLWHKRLAVLAGSHRPHTLLLEFVKDDNPDQLFEDAGILRALIHERARIAG